MMPVTFNLKPGESLSAVLIIRSSLHCVAVFVCCFSCLHRQPHNTELKEPGQPPRHDVELNGSTAPRRAKPIRSRVVGIHGTHGI